MKFLSKHYLLGLFAMGLFLVSCDDDDNDDNPPTNSGPTQNIAEIASGNPDYSILVEALTAADLVGAVADESATLTVFAPNNDAFNTLFDVLNLTDDNNDGSRVDELVNALGAETVTQILLYHVLGSEVRAADVPTKGYVTTSSTFSPNENQLSMLVESRSNGVFINNATQVNAPDILATNGVIHGVDMVILLPTVYDHAANNTGDFSTLKGAVDATDLDEALSNPDAELTVFAPVNSAFEAISDVVDGLTTEQLQTVLLYHVVGSEERAEDIMTGSVETLSTQSIGINVAEDGTVTIADADEDNVDATVVVVDVQGTNGVVHAINAVLIPEL